jgi:regulatory protein
MPDALAIAYTYLNRRERTVAEVRARLERAECPAAEAEAAITELLELRSLDDARYARLFIEDKRNLDGWGSERIQRALAEHGVDREVIAAAFAELGEDGESELDRAVTALQRRFRIPAEDPRDQERAFAMLVRKGYGSDVAGDAVRAWTRR